MEKVEGAALSRFEGLECAVLHGLKIVPRTEGTLIETYFAISSAGEA
jgi:hypothetical protein